MLRRRERPAMSQAKATMGSERPSPEPQRGSILQPRVARHELPWEMVREIFTTLKGLHQTGHGRTRQPDLLQPLQG